MKELIKITETNGQKLVSAKELYDGLGLRKKDWSRWYNTNIINNEFFYNGHDFIGVPLIAEGNKTMDFAISLEFAKHIAMMARTEKSHEYRNYFIECEKQLKEIKSSYMIEDPIERAKAWIKEEEERQLLQAKIKEDEPKIEQYEDLLSMKSSHTMNEVAKIVGIGRNKLFAALREKHVLMKNNLPFETYKSRGYFEVREIIINHTNYEEVKRQTLVTISGIDWINKKMKQWNVK